MNPPNPAFKISNTEYNSIKAFVARCWAKYPQYVQTDGGGQPLSIEIDEDSSAPIASICWFVKKSLRSLIAVPMNQAPRAFESEFVRVFNAFHLNGGRLGK